jgi:hypothetical protein
MPESYELIFGFVHCRGRTEYSAGRVGSKEEAEAWVKNQREGLLPKITIPPEDPIRYCRAAWCPFKRQKPWFDMRPSEKTEAARVKKDQG